MPARSDGTSACNGFQATSESRATRGQMSSQGTPTTSVSTLARSTIDNTVGSWISGHHKHDGQESLATEF
ncbi:hypothetical protein J6590_015534 [Homalodisca vitripennis]|nr:hypothetical protein J6590_015534 [Homalodisca vitripennis]